MGEEQFAVAQYQSFRYIQDQLSHLRLYAQLSIIITKQMFNPKEALERLRSKKNEKKQENSIEENVEPLFPAKANTQPADNLEDRVTKLEDLITKLTDQLQDSNQTVSKLKRENSNLETQILKLQYENSQLKSQNVYSQLRRQNSSSRIPESIREENKQRQKSYEKPKIKVDTWKSPFNNPPPVQKPEFSVEVQDFVAQIKNQPVQNILKRKQQEFRALKADKRQSNQSNQSQTNRYLQELAKIQKNYQKSVQSKPILAIKLDDADFQ